MSEVKHPTLEEVQEYFKGAKLINIPPGVLIAHMYEIVEDTIDPGRFLFKSLFNGATYTAFENGKYAEILERDQSLEDQVNEYDANKFDPELPFECGNVVDEWYPMEGWIYVGTGDIGRHILQKKGTHDFAVFNNIRNIKQPEFTKGQPVWFKGHPASSWHFGAYCEDGTVLNQLETTPLKVAKIRPFFVNGQATHPPFND
jgi:hypothetical protein